MDMQRRAKQAITWLRREDDLYPEGLKRHLGDAAPTSIAVLGAAGILQGKKLALFCSVRCPGDLILKTYDFAQELRRSDTTIVGGFHSPMEQECLRILLRGTLPIIICPARSIENMRIPAAWKKPLAQGSLLLLSPFDKKIRRPTAELARQRNRFVTALAEGIFIAHAETGSMTEALAREAVEWGKPLFTLESSDNDTLISLGAKMRPIF